MKNIIIFGASQFGKDTYIFYKSQNNTNIIAFSDNDIKVHNTILLGIKVINPQDILLLKYDEIVIASSFDNEIHKQLIALGIDTKKISIISLNQVKAPLKKQNTRKLAEQLLIDISKLFNNEKINYHIDHGTLLGIIRDNSIMPWDIDVDIAILSEDRDNAKKVLNTFLKTYSSKYCKYNNWKYKEHLSTSLQIFNDCDDKTSNSFSIEILLKYTQNNDLYWMVGSRKLMAPIKICFPPTSIIFKNQKIKAPKDTPKYLQNLYGNWEKVIKQWSYNQYSNIRYD